MKRDKIIAISAVIALILVTNAGQYALQARFSNSAKIKYESQIKALNDTLKAIGPLVDVFTPSATVKDGKIIAKEDLETEKIPESMIHEGYVTNSEDVLGKQFKIKLHKGTPITEDMIMSEKLDNSMRHIDLTASVFPVDLVVGDYIDFRIIFPKGEDYIVLSHKRVDSITGSTINVVLTEEDILYYNGATVDNFLHMKEGSTIYMTKYVEAGLQEPATRTYAIPLAIQKIITNNPNIVAQVKNGTISREVMESSITGLSSEDKSLLGASRSNYLSKLQQARDLYTTKQDEMKTQQAEQKFTEETTKGSESTDTNPVKQTIDKGTEAVETITDKSSVAGANAGTETKTTTPNTKVGVN